MSHRKDAPSPGRPRKATPSRRGIEVVALLSLAACVPADGSGPALGAPAPALSARTLDGDSISLAQLRGRVVLLNFWATWCAPCRHETPFLDSLHALRSGDGLEVVGISVDAAAARDQVAAFVEELGVRYTILLDPEMRGSDRYAVLGLPASFLLDRSGVLRWRRFGPVSGADREFLDALDAVLR